MSILASSSLSSLGPADLYAAHRSFVHRALRGLGVRSSEVEDLTHDVFITLQRKGTTFPHDRAARAWLFATARRTASNARRAQHRAAAREPAWTQAAPVDPDAMIERRQAADAVRKFADTLPTPVRRVFELSEVKGLAAPEVADELGLNLNTTYSHIRRVRQRFARAIAVGIGLMLLLFGTLMGNCATEAHADARVALHRSADLAR